MAVRTNEKSSNIIKMPTTKKKTMQMNSPSDRTRSRRTTTKKLPTKRQTELHSKKHDKSKTTAPDSVCKYKRKIFILNLLNTDLLNDNYFFLDSS